MHRQHVRIAKGCGVACKFAFRCMHAGMAFTDLVGQPHLAGLLSCSPTILHDLQALLTYDSLFACFNINPTQDAQTAADAIVKRHRSECSPSQRRKWHSSWWSRSKAAYAQIFQSYDERGVPHPLFLQSAIALYKPSAQPSMTKQALH